MPLESLLVSRDPEVVRVLRSTLEKLAIAMEVCRGARSGNEILLAEKFDAVIVDCDDLHEGLHVLENLRRGTSNKNSVAFAIVNGSTSTQKAFQLGANFVLPKPVTTTSAMRCFGAAVSFMVRERRRYFRHPIEMPVTVVFGEGQELKCTATNISDGGMAILFHGRIPKGGVSRVVFKLPGNATPLEPKAQIAWADGTGRAGLRFTDLANSRQPLQQWLNEQFDRLETQSD